AWATARLEAKAKATATATATAAATATATAAATATAGDLPGKDIGMSFRDCGIAPQAVNPWQNPASP
ncbi:hypothetical protein, partial [Pseudomonas sp. UBA5568]|uniref:hypothetical protein n=1 Tax=Pseudomonas sp. UBA5568 TaxID=1947319 RepID=UPI002594F2C6